jgi:hypothetical protein
MNDLFQYQFCGFLPQTLVKFNPSITRKWIATLRSDLDLCHQGVPPLRRANLAARVFSRMARLLRNLDLSLEHLEASRCVWYQESTAATSSRKGFPTSICLAPPLPRTLQTNSNSWSTLRNFPCGDCHPSQPPSADCLHNGDGLWLGQWLSNLNDKSEKVLEKQRLPQRWPRIDLTPSQNHFVNKSKAESCWMVIPCRSAFTIRIGGPELKQLPRFQLPCSCNSTAPLLCCKWVCPSSGLASHSDHGTVQKVSIRETTTTQTTSGLKSWRNSCRKRHQ